MKISNLFKVNFKDRQLELAVESLYDAEQENSRTHQELLLKQAMVSYSDARVLFLKSLVATLREQQNEITANANISTTATKRASSN